MKKGQILLKSAKAVDFRARRPLELAKCAVINEISDKTD